MPKISALGGMSSRGFGEFAQQTAANYIEDVFSTYLYTGNGSTQTITNGVDLSTKGGMVWLKSRNVAGFNYISDTDRGTLYQLVTSTTSAQQSSNNYVTSFNSNGFNLGANPNINNTNDTFASWTFRKQPKFFDVITYTGNGVAGRTISHNLGSVPGMIIVKTLSKNSNWMVYHRASSATPQSSYLTLQSSSGVSSNPYTWNNTQPTATVFTVGDTGQDTNDSGATYVAYLFAHNAGGFGADGSQNVISCGSFTADGTGAASVTLGYEPQFIIAKTSSTTGGWFITDTMRGWSMTSDAYVYANTSGAEVTNTPNYWNPTATGFTCNAGCFPSNSTVIYMAIRRGPMRTPTSGTSVFQPLTRTGTGANATITTGINQDLIASYPRNGSPASYGEVFFDKLRGTGVQLLTASTGAETTASSTYALQSFLNTGVQVGADFIVGYINYTSSPYVNYGFVRAPGFFDIVCYSGDNSTSRNLNHNLGVIPEILIIKCRNSTTDGNSTWNAGWWTAVKGSGATGYWFLPSISNGGLNTTNASPYSDTWSAYFTSTTTFNPFYVSLSSGSEGVAANVPGKTYVAYLFATCPGVSKVGSYTGTGGTQTISCGFTGGARFVMIKRTDSTGSWWVWDTARGMVTGTDPRFAYNSTANELNNDWVYTTTGGFQIVTSDATVNASGGTYIYLAIA